MSWLAESSGEWPRFAWFNEELKAGRYPRPVDLQRRFNLSRSTAKRTIERFERDLNAPVAYDASKKGYYYPPGCRAIELPPFWLVDETSTILLQAIATLGASVRDGRPLTEPFASLLPGKYATLVERLVIETIEHHPPDARTLQVVVEALASDRKLHLRYAAKPDQVVTTRLIEPLVLYQFSGNWYVYAYCHARGECRLFALDRILEVPQLGAEFDRDQRTQGADPRFLLKGVFGLYKREEREWARIRFSPLLSPWIRDQVWHAEQRMTQLADGRVELYVPFAGEGIDLLREVLKYGSDAELLEPGWLRDEIRKRLGTAQALYATDPPDN